MNAEFVPVGSIIDVVDTGGCRIGFWRCVSSEDRGIWNWHDVPQRENENGNS